MLASAWVSPHIFGVEGKVLEHVFVYQLLQIYSKTAQGTHHHIGAHAFVQRHIAIGVGQHRINRVIRGGFADLTVSRGDQWNAWEPEIVVMRRWGAVDWVK